MIREQSKKKLETYAKKEQVLRMSSNAFEKYKNRIICHEKWIDQLENI